MRSLFLLVSALLCGSGHAMKSQQANAVNMPSGMTVVSCKTMCQRFGMKLIGSQFEEVGEAQLGGEFKQMTSPVDCSKKCEQLPTMQAASPAAPESVAQTAQKVGSHMRGTAKQ